MRQVDLPFGDTCGRGLTLHELHRALEHRWYKTRQWGTLQTEGELDMRPPAIGMVHFLRQPGMLVCPPASPRGVVCLAGWIEVVEARGCENPRRSFGE